MHRRSDDQLACHRLQVLPASAVAGKYRLYLPAEFVASARLTPGTVQVPLASPVAQACGLTR